MRKWYVRNVQRIILILYRLGFSKKGRYDHSTWATKRDVDELADWARFEGFDGVYGVPRAGVIVAAMLSYRLGLPLILEERGVSVNTLVVDEISDRGNTLWKLQNRLIKRGFCPRMATLFISSYTRYRPDKWIHIKTAPWVQFCHWETSESSKYDHIVSSGPSP